MEEDKDTLVVMRVLNAPRKLVWKAWTDPEIYMKWWGPKDFTTPVSKVDLRVGGKYLSCMRSPDGKDYWSSGVYKEIMEPEKLVMTDSFADEKGNIVPSTHYGLDKGFPMEMLVTVLFEGQDMSKTRMTLKHSGVKNISNTDRRNMELGWNQSFDKLEQILKEKQHVLGGGVLTGS